MGFSIERAKSTSPIAPIPVTHVADAFGVTGWIQNSYGSPLLHVPATAEEVGL